MSIINELKRRNVFKVGVAYVIVTWLLAQVADLMLENFGAPNWVMKSFLGFLVIGFPLALFFAWAFEMTPEGIKKEKDVDRSQSITPQTGQKLNSAIIGIMAIALAWFVWDKFGSTPEVVTATEVAQPSPAKTVIATHGCTLSNWIHTVAPPFGYAERFQAMATEERLCDPLSSQAWLGDKEKASSIAAKMDARPYGPNGLVTMIYWCACGMPWDLEATPVFAGKVKESGLPWPPVSPLKFPLKDW